eukprot:gb/GECG01012383.1/.p1 GENE.gb/GECG01012383.1/~~gb/GECG01012383.1/.p1  ORF type:complete len:138 (+),score=15.68 gb/GECG01012383.1/:1-414(+)
MNEWNAGNGRTTVHSALSDTLRYIPKKHTIEIRVIIEVQQSDSQKSTESMDGTKMHICTGTVKTVKVNSFLKMLQSSSYACRTSQPHTSRSSRKIEITMIHKLMNEGFVAKLGIPMQLMDALPELDAQVANALHAVW